MLSECEPAEKVWFTPSRRHIAICDGATLIEAKADLDAGA